MSFDVIVIGAGSAGCVLAARLSEDPWCEVLLLEAGPHDTRDRIPADVNGTFALRGSPQDHHAGEHEPADADAGGTHRPMARPDDLGRPTRPGSRTDRPGGPDMTDHTASTTDDARPGDVPKPDLGAVTNTQRDTWASGDFHEIARHNVVMAERLCPAVGLHAGERVLDVACGSGTVALVAARHYAEVTGIDYVPQLIERARQRAQAEGYAANLLTADAQELPFPDDSFDVVLSTYGVQFAPDQQRAADELLRVCRPGGRIGLASPLPEGWSGEVFALHGQYAPPPPGVPSPLRWGTEDGLQELLGHGVSWIKSEALPALQYYRSVEHAVEVFSTWFGPTLSALQRIGPEAGDDLLRDIGEVFRRYNTAVDGTAVVENTYLQTVAVVA